MQKRLPWRFIVAVLLLWAFFAQSVASMVVHSPTVDEQAHLMRGYVYLKLGSPIFKIGHPILADTLSALPLWALTDLKIPADEVAFRENDWGNYSDRFVWQMGNNVDLVFFLSRLVMVALGMLFGALVYRWAGQLWQSWAGLVALTLFVFDPTIVAHSQLVTHDVSVSLFYFAATYCLWRYLETNRARDLALTGVTLGLALGSKFSALLLIPIFVGIVGMWPFLHGELLNRWRWLARHAFSLLAIFAIGALALWALYRFDLHPLPGQSLPVPAPAFFEDLLWEVKYFGLSRYFFLFGEHSASGWWYYLPVAFAIKSPLPAMLLIGAALIGLLVRRANGRRLVVLLLPASAYLTSTLVSPLDIGYRYFIPVLPFLYVLAGRLAASAQKRLRLFPDHLAYFNVLAGGPDNGWRYLVDSNIDWGQSLPALRDIVQQDHLGRIKLSYFGSAYPSYYGLDFEPLPTADLTPERGNLSTLSFYPHDPAPGIYAISATNLQGASLEPDKWDTYAWFRDKTPFAKAGYSIFLYRVKPNGPPVDLALSGLQVDGLADKTFAALGTNDVRLRWFDARTSLIIPTQPVWYALGVGDLGPWGWSTIRPCTTADGQTCKLYAPDPGAHAAALSRIEQLSDATRAWLIPLSWSPSEEAPSPLALPANIGNQIQFLGAEIQAPSEPDQVHVLTAWRVTAPPDGRRTIFVHLLAPDGQIVTQWDGLDVAVEGWQPGDTFVQRVSLSLPKDLPAGKYWIQLGVYNPTTTKRLPVFIQDRQITDRVLLDPILLSEAR
jgi:hypothetical protein